MTTVALPGLGRGLAAAGDGLVSEGDEKRIRGMFAEVITHALREATYSAVASPVGPLNLNKRQSGPSSKLRFLQQQAFDWLTRDDPGFGEVCELAGFNTERTRQRVRRILDQYMPAIRDYEARPTRARKGKKV